MTNAIHTQPQIHRAAGRFEGLHVSRDGGETWSTPDAFAPGEQPAVEEKPAAQAPVPANTIAPATAEETSAAVAANNAFTLELHKALAASEDGNFFASPFNVNGCMSMVLAGAGGTTADAIAGGLQQTALAGDRIHAGVGQLLESTDGDFGGVNIAISNRVFAQDGSPVKDGFKSVTAHQYGAEAENLNFAGDPDGSRQAINKKVEGDTRERIKDLLPEGSVTGDTRLVLTSAIHFKGDWAKKFDAENTFEADFFPAAGAEPGRVQMMHQTADYKVAQLNYDGSYPDWNQEPDLKVIDMPYQNERFSMVALLPSHESGGLAGLEERLTADTLATWTEGLWESEVNLAFPKFKMDSDFKLKDTLSEMGMAEAFQEGADFSNMSEDDLRVAQVFHKSFVEVNEEGTEFAAATGATMVLESVSRTVDFNANRPFMFFVKDNETGALLCSGRYTKPE